MADARGYAKAGPPDSGVFDQARAGRQCSRNNPETVIGNRETISSAPDVSSAGQPVSRWPSQGTAVRRR